MKQMKEERDHPCWGCEFFEYYRPIKTMYDRAFETPIIEVQIPVCSRIVYVFALDRCDEYVPDDFAKAAMLWKQKIELGDSPFGC